MGIGTPRPRNWGVDSQQAALNVLMHTRKVTFTVEKDNQRQLILKLAGCDRVNRLQLPFESVAQLVNVERGRWEALSLWDGRPLAKGVSQRDVVRAAIQELWH